MSDEGEEIDLVKVLETSCGNPARLQQLSDTMSLILLAVMKTRIPTHPLVIHFNGQMDRTDTRAIANMRAGRQKAMQDHLVSNLEPSGDWWTPDYKEDEHE